MCQMGLVESTLKIQSVKSVVRPDSSAPLPSFSLETAKFTDGSVGFAITCVDIAKNTTVSLHGLKSVFAQSENTYIYVCSDDSVFTFTKDLESNRVFCLVNRANTQTLIVRQCVTTYEPLENDDIDKIARLFNPKV